MPSILHVDADCFFASVELLSYPHLRGKPVIVCTRQDNRGIVLAATYEARTFGIKAGTPLFKVRTLCPQAILLQSHHSNYAAASRKLMLILRDISPDVEEYSIDEAFVDLKGLRLLYRTDYIGIARMIQERVYKELGITVSIGLAPTKLLAKIASDFKKPNGLTVVHERRIEEFLAQVPMKDVPGIGPNTAALLAKHGFVTALDVAHSDTPTQLLGKRGAYLHAELNGTPTSGVQADESLPKSLSHTSTFQDFLRDRAAIFAFSFELLTQLSARLRSFDMETADLTFFLAAKDFSAQDTSILFLPATNEDKTFIAAFHTLFERVFRPGILYRKAGFFMHKISLKKPKQYSLFERVATARPSVDGVFDKIRHIFGPRSLARGSLLRPPRAFFQGKKKI